MYLMLNNFHSKLPRRLSSLLNYLSLIRRMNSLNNNKNETIHFETITVKSSFNRLEKSIPNVSYLQKNPSNSLNLYCCGPTVYSDSHLGHAITYIRCDLIIRMLNIFCNNNVYFAMNITDIDDKIINKSNETGQHYRDISEKYFQSFTDDMRSLRVKSPDFFGKVVDNIDVIADYIRRIYEKGYAYVNELSGDVNFNYEKFINDYSINNEINYGANTTPHKSLGKRSPKDFSLWKASKANEPRWTLKLNDKISIEGRPGITKFLSNKTRLVLNLNLNLLI